MKLKRDGRESRKEIFQTSLGMVSVMNLNLPISRTEDLSSLLCKERLIKPTVFEVIRILESNKKLFEVLKGREFPLTGKSILRERCSPLYAEIDIQEGKGMPFFKIFTDFEEVIFGSRFRLRACAGFEPTYTIVGVEKLVALRDPEISGIKR
jgi:hypothetical protein